MARIQRPGEDPVFKPPKTQNRGNNRGGSKPKRKPSGPGAGPGGGGGGVSPPTTPGTTTAFAVQDPAAWMRANMVAAGMPVNDATAYGRFQQDAIVSPFVAGWQEWKATNPAANDQDFWDYAQGTGMGLPETITGGPPAEPGAATSPMAFNAFVRDQTGKGKGQLGKNRRQRLKTAYGTYVDEFAAPAANPQTQPGTLSPQQWQQFQAYAQNTRDKYTLQQQGRFDQGKQPGSIRINLFN